MPAQLGKPSNRSWELQGIALIRYKPLLGFHGKDLVWQPKIVKNETGWEKSTFQLFCLKTKKCLQLSFALTPKWCNYFNNSDPDVGANLVRSEKSRCPHQMFTSICQPIVISSNVGPNYCTHRGMGSKAGPGSSWNKNAPVRREALNLRLSIYPTATVFFIFIWRPS